VKFVYSELIFIW